MPAANCGLVGHKPTWGLVPYTGAFPIEASIDHLGPITRTVTDAALMLSVIAGPDGHDPRQPTTIDVPDYVAALSDGATGLRVGVLREGFGLPESEPEVDDAVRAAVTALSDAGMDVREVSVPWHLHGSKIWDVIATEGAASQMIENSGYGLNWKGLYDPELMEQYGRRWHEDGAALPRHRQARPARRQARAEQHPRQALRDGPQPRAEAGRRVRRRARRGRPARPPDDADARSRASRPRRARRRTARPGAGDARQHQPLRRHRPPGLLGARRARRRRAGGDVDRRPPVRRRHRPARRARLRAGRRRLPRTRPRPSPRPDLRTASDTRRSDERSARSRRTGRSRRRRPAPGRAGVEGGVGEARPRDVPAGLPRRVLRRRLLPLRHGADRTGRVPDVHLLRALGPLGGPPRRAARAPRPGRDREAHAVLPGEPGRPAARGQGPRRRARQVHRRPSSPPAPRRPAPATRPRSSPSATG